MPSYDEVADGLRMPLADAMETQLAIRRLCADPVDDATVLPAVGASSCYGSILGWPQGNYGPTTRRPIEEITHVDDYGNRAFPGTPWLSS